MSINLSKNALDLLEQRYLIKNEDGEVIETPKEMFQRVAKNIASAEKEENKREKYEKKFYDLMTSLKFLPNSPTLMNAGAELQQLAACFVLPVEDSMEGIFDSVKNAALIHKSGGGTGFSFSRLRPKGDVVKSTGGVSSGPISFMEVFNSATNTVKQGGKRRGANMGVLRVDHPDILDFINAKAKLNSKNKEIFFEYKNANPDISQQELDFFKQTLLDNQFSNFNLSVALTEEFIQAVRNKKNYDLINPKTKKKEGSLYAPKVYENIVKNAWENGEPGILFLDRINEKHPIEKEIEATNPCGEQPLLPWEACNLGSINLSKFVENKKINWDKLKETIKIATRFLDNVISVNNYPLEKIKEEVEKYRKIGLGVMGLHECLIKLNVAYDSKQGVETSRKIMKFINETAHEYSKELAKEKGEFPAFEESIYKNPQRNATLTTIAPTGSISFLAGTSGGIEPFFSFKYSHTDADGNVSTFEYDFTKEADEKALVTAPEIKPEWHIKIQSAIQEHVDNAVSKTINFPNSASKEDIKKAYDLAFDLECKGLTIYRDGSKTSQVLSNDDEDDKSENKDKTSHKEVIGEIKKELTPSQRPIHTKGETIRYDTGCGKLYLTVNYDENDRPFETFITTGSEGGCQIMTEGVSRLTSLALRSGIDIDIIIDQLKSTNTCPSFMYEKGKNKDLVGKSCPDIVAKMLKKAKKVGKNNFAQIDEGKHVEKESVDEQDYCPECGNELNFSEGCKNCSVCGYSKCS